MSRMVQCTKYKKTLPGLDRPPYPGPKGVQIYEQVSAQAWAEWQAHQTRLINEKHLVMTNPDTRVYLMNQMEKFLNGEAVDEVEGYVPDDKTP